MSVTRAIPLLFFSRRGPEREDHGAQKQEGSTVPPHHPLSEGHTADLQPSVKLSQCLGGLQIPMLHLAADNCSEISPKNGKRLGLCLSEGHTADLQSSVKLSPCLGGLPFKCCIWLLIIVLK